MSKSLRKRRNYPYYKIQIFDEISQVWKDERKVFDTIEAAQAQIKGVVGDKLSRIIVVERTNRDVLNAKD